MATKVAADVSHDPLGKRIHSETNDENYPPSKRDIEKVKKRLKLDDDRDSSTTTTTNNNNKSNIPMDQQQPSTNGTTVSATSSPLFMQCHLLILKSLYMNNSTPKEISAAFTSPSLLSLANRDEATTTTSTTTTSDITNNKDSEERKSIMNGGVLVEEGKVDQDVWDLIHEFLNKRHLLKTNQAQSVRLQQIHQESQRVLLNSAQQQQQEQQSNNNDNYTHSANPFGDVSSTMPSPTAMRPSTKYPGMASNRPSINTTTNNSAFGTTGIPPLSANSASSSPHHHHNPLSMMMYSPRSPPLSLFGNGGGTTNRQRLANGTTANTSATGIHALSSIATPSPSWAFISNLLEKKVNQSQSKTKAMGNRFRFLDRSIQKRLKRLMSLRLALVTKQCQLEQEKALELLGTSTTTSQYNDTINRKNTKHQKHNVHSQQTAATTDHVNQEGQEMLVILDTKIQLWKLLAKSLEEVKL